ncbi:MAG TPA: NAD(P)-binding domain-containing protein, partial [Polyangiaceae bacterium]
MTRKTAQFGIIGTAVMGRNLALNVLDHGFSVAAWNRERELLDRAVKESGARLIAADSLSDLVEALERPRRLLVMIKADAVDKVLPELAPLLDPGDIVIDGGNSLFLDTRRREQGAKSDGYHFVGVGVSG